ncbi:cupin domain-containing protein [Chloroflexota bacterium]
MEYKSIAKVHYEITAYEKWMEQQEIPVIRAFGVEDVNQVPRAFWPYLGCPTAFIHLDGMEGWTGMYVAEIPPGGSLNPEKHLYEEEIYVLQGRGLTEVGLREKKQVFEWKEGSLFSPPLNTWHRLVNGTREPVIFLAITNAPLAMDMFHNPDFIFNCDYEFKDRYAEEEGYFSGEGVMFQQRKVDIWQSNFVPDAFTVPLRPAEWKAVKGTSSKVFFSGNMLGGHIFQWPGGIYHKAHYHAGGAIILSLNSKGYWLMWPDEVGTRPYQSGREDTVIKVNFKPGTVVSPPTRWFHQRFNTGPEPARQFAITLHNNIHPFGAALVLQKGEEGTRTSTLEGGTLIEYKDEDPEIRIRFEAVLKQDGVQSNMPPEVYQRG